MTTATFKEQLAEVISNSLSNVICLCEIVIPDVDLSSLNYTINEQEKTIEITSINYAAHYNANGNYDIVIPANFGEYQTVLVTK